MTTSSTDPTRMTKRTCGVLTWRMYIYREVVFTKVVPNHLDSQYESSKWSSRLPYPPQIQSKGKRTGGVLITFGFLFACLIMFAASVLLISLTLSWMSSVSMLIVVYQLNQKFQDKIGLFIL